MTQEKCVKAYKALEKLMGQNLTLQAAVKVFNMYDKLQRTWTFQLNEEKKILERHPNVKTDTGFGAVNYDPNDKETEKTLLAELDSFTKEIKALGLVEQAIEIEPFDLFTEAEDIKMTGTEIQNLQGFINFK